MINICIKRYIICLALQLFNLCFYWSITLKYVTYKHLTTNSQSSNSHAIIFTIFPITIHFFYWSKWNIPHSFCLVANTCGFVFCLH